MPKRTPAMAGGRDKPAKPHKDFPLFPHATGRWAKKVRGRLHYFGPWRDPKGALDKWLAQKDDLLAGRHPRDTSDGFTVADSCNTFLASRKRRMGEGEVSPRMFSDYFTTARIIATTLGRTRLVSDLRSGDFAKLRDVLAETRGPVALANAVQRVRTTFKYAFDAGAIDRPVLFGPDFRKPSRRTIRHAKHAAKPKMFTAAEIRQLHKAASPTLRSMILLGVNCGFGQTDIAELRDGHVNGEWIDFPRPKTGVNRRCWLWPETVKALGAARKTRPAAQIEADADRIFITRFGQPWLRVELRDEKHEKAHTYGKSDAIALEFRKLIGGAKLHQPGRGFYALRHTFRTIADEIRDRSAIDAVMGHDDGTVGRSYVETVDDDRLRKVAQHVRRWLYGAKAVRA